MRYILTSAYAALCAFVALAAGYDADPNDAPAAVYTALATLTAIPLVVYFVKWGYDEHHGNH